MADEETQNLGFVVPEMPPGMAEAGEPAADADPFEQLEEALEQPEETPEDEEGPEGEEFQNLEEEYRVLAALKREVERRKASHSEAVSEYEAHRKRMMRAMKAQGTRQFRSTAMERGACHFKGVYSAKIKDPSLFIPWAKQNCEEILTVNAQTLSSHIRRHYRDRGVPPGDESFPPGLEVKEFDTLQVSVPKEE